MTQRLVAIALGLSCGPALGCRPASPVSVAPPPPAPVVESPPRRPRVEEVVLGTSHGCLRFSEGSVRCWGENAWGQLGLGHTEALADADFGTQGREVPLSGAAVQLSAGGEHTCARLVDGRIQCWGDNRSGQLGLPWPKQVDYPYERPFFYGGVNERWPSAADERGFAWPASSSSPTVALGDDEVPHAAIPLQLPEPADHVASGRYHTCALTRGGRVFCWGWLEGLEPLAFHEVALPRHAVELVSGLHFACVRFEDGGIRCWGENRHGRSVHCMTEACRTEKRALDKWDPESRAKLYGFGRLGYLAVDQVPHTEVLVRGDVGDDFGPWTEPGPFPRDLHGLAAGDYFTCGLRSDSTIACWGDGVYWGTQEIYPPLNPTMGWGTVWLDHEPIAGSTRLASRRLDTCAIDKKGQVRCWGSSPCDPDTPWLTGKPHEPCNRHTASEFARVDLPLVAVDVAVGRERACAVLVNAEVRCWGRTEPVYTLLEAAEPHEDPN